MSIRISEDRTSRLLAVGTAVPESTYTQQEILDLFGVTDQKTKKIFHHSHIRKRHLCLPDVGSDNNISEESHTELLAKHKKHSVELGHKAVVRALEKVRLVPRQVDYFAVLSSTGFLCPGLSALLARSLGMHADVSRVDIVGMGCSAGLNGMQSVVNFCSSNPGKTGLLLCVETCSAMYVMDGGMNSAVVNSLFGDGAAAAVVSTRPLHGSTHEAPGMLGFDSYVIPDTMDSLRIDFNKGKYEFYLDKNVPYVLGMNVKKPVDSLLKRHGLKVRDIDHWVIHSGGRKVIDSIKYALNITEHAVRHTLYILSNYGNLSSGPFLFSYDRLLLEGSQRPGEKMFMMTMGPGATIECCLGEF